MSESQLQTVISNLDIISMFNYVLTGRTLVSGRTLEAIRSRYVVMAYFV